MEKEVFEQYKQPFELQLAKVNHFNKREWLEMLGIKDGDKVLEVGCGTGAFCLRIKQFYPNAKVVGLDIDKDKIEFAKSMAKSMNIDVEFIVADVKHIPYNDNEFSVVFSQSVIENIPTGVFLAEQYRVLKSAGKFCAITIEEGKGKRFDFPAIDEREEVLWEKLAKSPVIKEEYKLHLLDVPQTMKAIKRCGFIKPRVFYKNILWYNPDDSRFPSKFAKVLIRAKYYSDKAVLDFYQKLSKGLSGAEFHELEVWLLKKFEERLIKYNNGEVCWDLDSVFVRTVYAEKPFDNKNSV